MEIPSTCTAAEEEMTKLPAIVEEKYKKYLAERKGKIARHLSNIEKMAQKFQERELLHERDKIKIFQTPLLHQKADALLDTLINTTSFKDVLVVVRVFERYNNFMAMEYFNAIHNEIAATETFDHHLIVEYEVIPSNFAHGLYWALPNRQNFANKRKRARAIIHRVKIYQFEAALKKVVNIVDLIDQDPDSFQTSLHVALNIFDDADCHKGVKMILDRFEELVGETCNNESKISLPDFINMQCRGLWLYGTALHQATRNRDIPSVRLLYRNYGADMFIKDANGKTALEMMYLDFPEEVNFILDSSMTACAKSYVTGKMVICTDFSAVLGVAKFQSPGSEDREDEKRNKEDFSTNDLTFLANVVNTNSKRQKLFLPHPLVALFLFIQWRRYKGWILASAIMQICSKILYAALVVHVFLNKCRYDPPLPEEEVKAQMNFTPKVTEAESDSVSNTSADGAAVSEEFKYYTCSVDMVWKVLAGILAFFAGILILHENYIYDLENVLQLLCATCIIHICVEVLRGMFAGFDYAIASGSIILGSILILVELGNFPWFSVYIQIFIKVTKSFVKFLSLYGILIIAFSISFSIAFPKEESFGSLLEAIPKLIIMMSGEVEYKDLVYEVKVQRMFAMGPIVCVCFVLIMSYILTNLLIGLVVSDVKELIEKAQVVAISVTLERCNTMANTLRLRYWRCMLFPLKKLMEFSYWIIRKLETRSGGDMADLDADIETFELEAWHTMKLGSNNCITMLQLPEKLQKNIEQLLQRAPGQEFGTA